MADPKFHKVTEPKSLEELAKISGAEVKSDNPDFMIKDVAPLDKAQSQDISFLDNVKYKEAFRNTKAGACIVSKNLASLAPDFCHLLVSNNPYKSYALIAQAFYPIELPETEVSDKAFVAKTAKIGKGCVIQAGAFIGEDVELGEGCWVEPNAVIASNCVIGKNTRIGANASVTHAHIGESTRIYPGARIGQDGFGFAIDPAGYVKVPQLGRVIIGDHVEIGANSCIDRGSGPDTVIGDGAWLDNCVQIGHNVKVGKGCVIVAQAGIAGSTILEDYVVVAAQVGIAGHLTIGQGANIGAQSGVMNSLEAGAKVLGTPAVPIKQFMRQFATLKKLTNTSKSE